MIEFYTAQTPNGLKVALMLEETGLKFQTHTLNLKEGDQKKPEFLKVNPNGKIPSIVDKDGDFGRQIPVFESGAILNYLAEKSRKFGGTSAFEKAQVQSWLMFQMSGIGPAFGNHSYAVTNNIPMMATRFELESKRLIEVMNKHLADNAYFGGDSYSIADMAMYPWIVGKRKQRPDWFEGASSLQRWVQLVGSRPAVKKVVPVP